MIIPMVCFTCGKPIAHLWFGPTGYLALVKKFEIELADHVKDIPEQDLQKFYKEHRTPEFLALKELKIMRECCRRMFLCQHDMYEKVK
jgi:DNA-directed RNA polymerase subunit N (RpoN/RPB10)